jgi:hypothetical protein
MRETGRKELEKICLEAAELEERAAFIASSARSVKNEHERRIWQAHAQNLRRKGQALRAELSRSLAAETPKKSA